MTWHQHLDCRLLLLSSKAVLKGDGFLIEIQSIGAEARRAQREHTSGEIVLGLRGGVGEGSGAPGSAQPCSDALNQLPLAGIPRSPRQRIYSFLPVPRD